MDIEYDEIKYEITSMERVDYNTAMQRNVMNEDDKEEFENLLVTLISNDVFLNKLKTNHNITTKYEK